MACLYRVQIQYDPNEEWREVLIPYAVWVEADKAGKAYVGNYIYRMEDGLVRLSEVLRRVEPELLRRVENIVAKERVMVNYRVVKSNPKDIKLGSDSPQNYLRRNKNSLFSSDFSPENSR